MDMTVSPSTLEDLRREIDVVDDGLLDLLIRRNRLSQEVGRLKGGTGGFRPAREMQVLRRLLARREAPLDPVVLVRLWREIIGASLAQQRSHTIAVVASGDDRDGDLGLLAREHFGVLATVQEHSSSVRVLHALAAGEALLGLVRPPQPEVADPWWRYLARRGEPRPQVVARLPILPPSTPYSTARAAAYVVASSPVEPSGRDRSLLIAETGADFSRSAMRNLMAKVDLPCAELLLHQDGHERWLYLAEVDGFIAPDDERLAALEKLEREKLYQTWLVGSYAVPFSEADLMAGRTGAR